MGLDQAVYSVEKNSDVIECIADWRNQGRLQEWMENRHGEIILESVLGVGSTVTLTLPIARKV